MTYSWDTTAPVDTTFNASGIHTQIQQDKVSLRERFECPNASFNEHNDAETASSGIHVSSKVGWARASTLAGRYSSGLKVGSLHWVTDEGKMYVVNDDEEFVTIAETDHTVLEGLSDDDHLQYMLKSGLRAMSGIITLNGGTIQPEAYPTGDAMALNRTHVDESWYTAHGANCIKNRHIANEAVDGQNMSVEDLSWNSISGVTIADFCGFPMTREASGDGSLRWQQDGYFAVSGYTASWRRWRLSPL